MDTQKEKPVKGGERFKKTAEEKTALKKAKAEHKAYWKNKMFGTNKAK